MGVLPFQRSPSRRTKARPSLTDRLVLAQDAPSVFCSDRILPRSSSPFFFVFISCVVGFCARILLAACLGPRDLYIFPSSPPLGSFVCVKIKRLFAIARTRICTTKQQFIL